MKPFLLPSMPQRDKLTDYSARLEYGLLPDAPLPPEQAQEEAQSPATPLAQQPNQLAGTASGTDQNPFIGERQASDLYP